MLGDFFYISSELKKIPRKGWMVKVGVERPESVADHSYSVALMTMVLSEKHGLNTERMMKMALIHDLAESVTGDFMRGEISKEEKLEFENNAMREILSNLPPAVENEYLSIWEEYVKDTTVESSMLHDIDRLEMAIQAIKYSHEGFQKEKLHEFIESARNEIRSEELLKILDSTYYK